MKKVFLLLPMFLLCYSPKSEACSVVKTYKTNIGHYQLTNGCYGNGYHLTYAAEKANEKTAVGERYLLLQIWLGYPGQEIIIKEIINKHVAYQGKTYVFIRCKITLREKNYI